MSNPYLVDFSGVSFDWVYAMLATDPVLSDLGVEAYQEESDAGPEVPAYIVYDIASPFLPSGRTLDGIVTQAEGVIQVDVHGTNGYAALRPIKQRVLELFGIVHNDEIPGGGTILRCEYIGDTPSDSGTYKDTRYYRMGARFSVILQAT